ncbi:MAG: hypothetical protein ACKO96_47320 [Flammeovirgaceae bacterium]
MKALHPCWLLLVVFAWVLHPVAWSQSKPWPQVQADTALQQLNKRKAAAQRQADTLQTSIAHQLDTATGIQSNTKSKIDSLQQLANSPASKLDSAQQSLIGKWEQRQKKLQQQIDSLRAKKLPTAPLEAHANKLTQSLDSLRQKIKLPDVQKLTANATEWQTQATDKVNTLATQSTEGLVNKQKEINQAFSQFSDGKLSGLDKNITLPTEVPANLPNIGNQALPNTNFALPSLNATFPANHTTNLPSIPGGTTVNTPQVNGLALPTAPLPVVPNLNANVPQSTQPINTAQGQWKAYSGEMQKIREGRIDSTQVQKMAEQQLDVKELKKMREQEAAISNYQQMAERYRDPEAMKKELEQKSKAIANDKLAENSAKVQTALGELQDAKNKYGSFENITNLPKRPYNPWRGKPLVERLVPALGLQVQTTSNLWLDIAPHIGYRISQRWLAGIGWNERIAMNFGKGNYYIAAERVYGPRGHVQYLWRKVTFRADIECVNTLQKDSFKNLPLDQANRVWAWSCFVGIKQSFKITKKLSGYAHVSYNVYNPSNQSPYTDRLALRVGLEWPAWKQNLKSP